MALAQGTVKHFGLHRLEGVEVRVVADDEDGILRLEQAELDVVSRLSGDSRWQHKTVTLFVLADLQPLLRQLESLHRRPADARLQGREELLSRPVVNVYDLASPATCNVFVNRKAMMAAHYWEDALSITGLLAHEHAHPLAECSHTANLRRLAINVDLRLSEPWSADAAQAQSWQERSRQQVAALAVQLFASGPRELFTNTIAADSGFDRALYHLNRQNLGNLALGLQFRPALAAQLAKVVAQGQLSLAGAGLLRLIGDLQAFLPMAMEVAPFRRAGRGPKARELLKTLHGDLLPHLEPSVRPCFDALTEHFTQLRETAGSDAVKDNVRQGLAILTQALAATGAELVCKVEEVDRIQ
jgi:hypothetical protein